MSYKRKFIFLFLWLLLLVGLTFWGASMLKPVEEKELIQQEKLSEIEAEQYLLQISEKVYEPTQETQENQSSEENPDGNDVFHYDDDVLYSTHSVKEAWGHVDCVIEIPAIQLRQCVFTGTVEQLNHDLACWLPITARSDYVLGSTHYAIYMHNPRNKSIRISYAQFQMHAGDYIVITKDNYVYLYEVTGLFPEWREACNTKYTDNMSLSSELLYIFTCGREEWYGRNLVIEAKIYNTYHLDDWNENKDQYLDEYNGVVETAEQETSTKESLNMTIDSNENNIKVTVTTPNGIQATDCTIGIVNEDGFLVQDEIKYNGYPVEFNLTSPGVFSVGVYSNNTEYLSPNPYMVDVSKEKKTVSITTVEEHEQVKEDTKLQSRTLAVIILGFSYFMWLIAMILTIMRARKK